MSKKYTCSRCGEPLSEDDAYSPSWDKERVDMSCKNGHEAQLRYQNCELRTAIGVEEAV